MTTSIVSALPDSEGLRAQLENRCISHDEKVLSSGSRAKYYFDGKSAMALPSVSRQIGRLMAPLIMAAEVEGVGGLELGSIAIADAIGEALLDVGRELPKFIVRKEAKAYGTMAKIEQPTHDDGRPLISAGRKVAIVDDVITEGRSVRDAISAVHASDARVSLIAVIVERHEGGGDALRSDGYDVVSLFRTDEEGQLSVNPAFMERLAAATA